MVYRIYVEKKEEFASEAFSLKNEIINLLQIKGLKALRIVRGYSPVRKETPPPTLRWSRRFPVYFSQKEAYTITYCRNLTRRLIRRATKSGCTYQGTSGFPDGSMQHLLQQDD